MNSQQSEEEFREVNGIRLRITTYKVDNEFHCHASNADPNVAIARAIAATKEEAVKEVIRIVSEKILLKGKSL